MWINIAIIYFYKYGRITVLDFVEDNSGCNVVYSATYPICLLTLTLIVVIPEYILGTGFQFSVDKKELHLWIYPRSGQTVQAYKFQKKYI